jgi:transposase
MSEPITYVGIDAHARELQVAMLVGEAAQPVSWTSPTEESALARLRRRLERAAPGPVECCYEAGPSGYALQRRLTGGRVTCHVIAPSLIPRKPGDRVKTNRRDARKLAVLLRAGLLTTVHPPTEDEESVRDLCRARDDARRDLMRGRHRLARLLLRRGRLYHGRNWTKAHAVWLNQLAWPHPADQHVVSDYRCAIAQLEARLAEHDRLLTELAQTAPYAAPVAALRCFRGIDTISAILLVAELHDIHRFPHPRALMAFTGLVPSEASTGDRRRLGAITKTGNGQVRRVLIEAAWHYRHAPRPSPTLRQRRTGQPAAVIAIATTAEHRLCHRHRRLVARQKPRPLVTTAVARELAGFVWAALQVPEARGR